MILFQLLDIYLFKIRRYFFLHKVQKGQLAVEYVLLLTVVLSLCLIFLEFFKVGDTDQGGSSLVRLYRRLVEYLGQDLN